MILFKTFLFLFFHPFIYLLSTPTSSNPTKSKPSGYLYSDYFIRKNSIFIQLLIGAPLHTQYWKFDLLLKQSVFNEWIYSPYSSACSKLHQGKSITNFHNSLIKGTRVEDAVSLNLLGPRIENWNFIWIENDIDHYWNLAFGLDIPDKSFSLLHLLHQERRISNLRFYIIPPTTHRTNGGIYYGDIPINIARDWNAYPSARIKVPTREWSAVLKGIKIRSYSFAPQPADNVVYFSTVHSTSYVPEEFLSFLLRSVLGEYIDKGDCYYVTSNTVRDWACPQDTLGSFGSIAFYIDDYKFEIPFSLFFLSDAGRSSVFDIKTARNAEGGSVYEFGLNFVSKYAIEFNVGDREMIFYKGEVNIPDISWSENAVAFDLRSWYVMTDVVLMFGFLCGGISRWLIRVLRRWIRCDNMKELFRGLGIGFKVACVGVISGFGVV